MEKEALLGEERERKWGRRMEMFMEEQKKVWCIAAPMVVVSVFEFLLQVVALMMAGHINKLSLSGVAIATSFTNVTGFTLLFGLAGGLETLCGQAYGAEQYRKLGTYTYCAIASLLVICLPVSVFWIFMDKFLIFIGQDPQVSIVARNYSIWLIPALFAYAILQSLIRYFQTQSLIFPLLLSSCATVCLHIPLSWALVYRMKLGNMGAAVSIGLSYWMNVIFLCFYMRRSPLCEKTRFLNWNDVLSSIKEFFRFAVPSAIMVCLEWWTFEFLILLAGLLPNSQLETSVLSICLSTTALHYFVQYGIGAAASTRVSNELGAGNHQAARAVVVVVLVVSLMEAFAVSATLFFCRHVFGYAYSNEKEVVDYVSDVAPLLCLSVIMDSLLAVLSGIARGCGWQHIGAFVNLGAYYLVGLPAGVVLCFILHLRGKGLWIGIVIGSTLQAILLALTTALTNWQKQAAKARMRITEGTFSADHERPYDPTSF